MEKVKFVDTALRESIAGLLNHLSHRTLVLWAVDCAEHVLLHFEVQRPYDNRPREAIEAGRAWVRSEISMKALRTAASSAHAAARETDNAAAGAAARAAGQAAATAHVAGHAVHAATYAAQAAAFAADPAGAYVATIRERGWQYQHLVDLGYNLE